MARMSAFVDQYLADRRGQLLRILDLGSMNVNGSYRSLFDDPAWTYVGADIQSGPGVDVVVANPYRWKFPSRSFDVVVSGQVFEHIEFPWASMLEIRRVLRPGGLLCAIAPSAGPEHRFPVDCWRFYPDGFRALAMWADLDALESTTDWKGGDWADESSWFRDSVLIARRRPQGRLRSTVGGVKRAALRLFLSRQATRRMTPLGEQDDTGALGQESAEAGDRR